MKAQLIGAALGAGAQDQRTRRGAQALFEQGLARSLEERGIELAPNALVSARGEASYLEALPLIAEFNRDLFHRITRSLSEGHFPMVLGGDHSIAVGTWSALATMAPGQDCGLIWIDAHLDSHTVESTESGAVHGMPLAALLGHGDPRLTCIGSPQAKFKPENVFVLGARSFETGERDLLERVGVRVFYIEEIRDRGFGVCLEEAMSNLRRRTPHWGVTLDLDAFDPREIPAIGSPVPGGLFFEEVFPSLLRAIREDGCRAFELVEYNPDLDPAGRVFQKIVTLLAGAGKARGLERPPCPLEANIGSFGLPLPFSTHRFMK